MDNKIILFVKPPKLIKQFHMKRVIVKTLEGQIIYGRVIKYAGRYVISIPLRTQIEEKKEISFIIQERFQEYTLYR